jgi:diguanylate cyclase (GGDEF)-like protein
MDFAMLVTNAATAVRAALRQGLQRFTHPPVLFALVAVLLLSTLWGTTLNLVRIEDENARLGATLSSTEIAETYEAQVVRALREIDQTLKFVTYTYSLKGEKSVLAELQARTLLLPEFIFTVSTTDSAGNVVASTSTSASTSANDAPNIASRDYFQQQLKTDTFAVGSPQQDPKSGEWRLSFSRRLVNVSGDFAGVAVISVDASYFVSGYEQSKLGSQGVLGILGIDGVFRARRSGDAVFSGDAVEYSAIVTESENEDPTAMLRVNPWDGERRYTVARKLYEFPLAVVVGLSEQEQLQPAAARKRLYLWRATGVSIALVALMALLGRLSWQLQQSRVRAMEEQVAHAQRVEYLAYHDSLTGLPNRSFFSKLLNQGMLEAKRYDRQIAALFMDLDRFKLINDTLGHGAGDELLIEVARRLKESLRESDTVARLGGDEFVVLLPEQNDEKSLTAVAEKILAAVAKPFTLAGQEYRVTVSIGISTYPRDAEDEQSLMKAADIAMYHAKERGKNNFQFYSAQLSANSLERLALEASLRRALERDEFRLHYQDKRNLRTGVVTGAEALLRWQHPDLGLILPLQFLSLAEETGLILPIGKWVIETACRHNMRALIAGRPALSVAVNLTARQFVDPELLNDIDRILRTTGMEPSLLELEITENALMSNLDKAVGILTGIKALGVRVAIDNFGTSYSSLSTLKTFHFDTIKIDGSVIRDAASNADDRSFIEAIIAMGRTLASTVVAEGVETGEQAQFLRDWSWSCDEVQGFYFSEPMENGTGKG